MLKTVKTKLKKDIAILLCITLTFSNVLISTADSYDTDDSKTLMKQVLKNLNIDPKLLKEKRVMNAISAAKDELVGVDEYESDAATYEEKQIALCYREYQKLLKNNKGQEQT